VLVLWLGWFGFNGGSTVSAADPASIARIVLVTNLAASSGFLAALAWARMRTQTLDLSMALNGVLAGLVAITAGCDVIPPGWSLVVGALGGVLCVEGVLWLDRLRIDDPVGAITVHGLAGIFGTVAVGLFGDEVGLMDGGGFGQLGIQVFGALAGAGAATVASVALWGGMKAWVPGGIRVSQEHELEGLDVAECGVDAYGEHGHLHYDAPLPRLAQAAE
jgi:Amt family ammonium transporter